MKLSIEWILKKAEETRKARCNQPWTSYEKALEQCRRVDARGDGVSNVKSLSSRNGRHDLATA
jgi:hypothetical protein